MTYTMSEQDFLAELEASMKELERERASFKGMIYGAPGTGKTIQAVHMAQIITPKDKEILLIDSAEGWVSLEEFPALKRRVHRQQIPNIAALELLGNAIANRQGKYANIGCVIIDEASSFSAYDQLTVARSRAMRETGNKNEDEIKLPDMGISSNRFKKFYAPMSRNKDCHVILVAHERIDKDNNAVTITSPAFLPTLQSHLSGLMHLVCRMTADERQVDDNIEYTRMIQVMPTRRIVAKTRIHFDSILVDPKEVIYTVKGWLDGTVDGNSVDVIHEDITEETAQTTSVETDDLSDILNDFNFPEG